MKEGTESKVKFKKLKRRLDLPEWQAIGLLESVWKLTRTSAPAGDIGRHSNEDIAACIEWKGDSDEMISALIETGWLDQDEEFRLIVHNWSQHVPQYLKGNFAKHKKTFADLVAKQRAKQRAKQPAIAPCYQAKPSQVQPNQTKPNQGKPINGASADLKIAYNPMDDQTVTEAEFIELWNATEGVTKIRKKTGSLLLNDGRRNKLAARLQEPDWWADFNACLAKFPLPGWFEGTKTVSADWILGAGNVDCVLEGQFDHSKTKPKANNSYFD